VRRASIRGALAFTFTFTFTFFTSDAWAQDAGAEILIAPGADDAPTVRASLSATEVGLGEVFYLFVSVDHQPGVEINLPAALPLGLEFEETARTDRLVKNPAGGLTREYEVALMAFALGPLVLPPIPVTWAAQGRAHDLATPPVPIKVTGVLTAADTTLRDIAPPVTVIRRDLRLVWIASGVLGALLVGLVTWRVVRRRRRDEAVLAAATEATRPPHEEALARLAEVEGSGALDADDRKPAYLEMSEILRGYLGRRYGFPAPELSTGEIRARLLEGDDAAEPLVKIVDWLERCDLVKYARGKASEDEARQALYDARIFVERTRDLPLGHPARTADAEAEVAS
jgi:hypothetical protein